MFGLVESIRVRWRKRQSDLNYERNMRWFIGELVKSPHGVDRSRLERFNVTAEDQGKKALEAAVSETSELMHGESWDTPEAFERLRALLADISDDTQVLSTFLTPDDLVRAYAIGVAEKRLARPSLKVVENEQ